MLEFPWAKQYSPKQELLLEVNNSLIACFASLILCPRYRALKEMLYEVRCLKSNEDMILALAGQFKKLSHEPEIFQVQETIA